MFEVLSKICFIFLKNYLYFVENKIYFEIYGKFVFFSFEELFFLQKLFLSVRVGFIYNLVIKYMDDCLELFQIVRIVEVVLFLKSYVMLVMLKFMENLLDESNDFDKLFLDVKVMVDFLVKILVCVIGSMNFV